MHFNKPLIYSQLIPNTVNDGDFFSVDIYSDRNTSDTYEGRPKVFHGVFGLIEVNPDQFHLLSEDDGHLWSTLPLNQAEITHFKDLLLTILGQLTIKDYSVYSPELITPPLDKSFAFDLLLNDAGEYYSLVISHPNLLRDELSFHPFWLPDLIKTLSKLTST